MDEALAYLLAQLETVRCLRKTARGETWLGMDQAGRPVIYKRLHRTGLPLAKLQKLAHPLWPEVYAFFEDEAAGETHVVEEYVQGEPMARRIETGAYLTEREARALLLALAGGLAVLHAHGILHRDIKPGNLLEPKGGPAAVRLIDFDAAREMKGGEADTCYLGTKGYAPPEQYGYAATDARSDIYALGMTVRELLGPAYHGSLTRILDRATEIDPKRRYPSVAALVRDLRYGRRLRFLRGAVAFGLVMLLSTSGYAFYLAQMKPEKLEELETTPVEELLEHPEELAPTVRRAEVREKEREKLAPPSGQTVVPTPGGDTAQDAVNQKPAEKAPATQEPETAPATEEAKPREEIRVHYSMDDYCFNAWTDAYDYPIQNASGLSYIPPSTWQTWEGDDNVRFFPEGAHWHIHVNVTNTTQETFPAPALHMEYDDGAATVVRDYAAPALMAGGSIDFDVPLAGLRIVNPGEEGYHAREMRLSVRGIDHELFSGSTHIDFIPKERPQFGW